MYECKKVFTFPLRMVYTCGVVLSVVCCRVARLAYAALCVSTEDASPGALARRLELF